MTLYEYINPILKSHPEIKCILYDAFIDVNDAIYTGKIGEIPSRYMVLQFKNVMLGNKYIHFWDNINKETEEVLRIWITSAIDINSELWILGGLKIWKTKN